MILYNVVYIIDFAILVRSAQIKKNVVQVRWQQQTIQSYHTFEVVINYSIRYYVSIFRIRYYLDISISSFIKLITKKSILNNDISYKSRSSRVLLKIYDRLSSCNYTFYTVKFGH